MSAADLLHRLHDAGLTLEPDGARVIVRPKSLLTDEQREAIRAHKAELLALLADRNRHCGISADSPDQAGALPLEAVATVRACKGCAHRTTYGTCIEPVTAGLADVWRIEWPPPGHAASCSAWSPREDINGQPRAVQFKNPERNPT